MTGKRRSSPVERSAARLGAVQALYQMDLAGTDVGETGQIVLGRRRAFAR